MRNLSTQNKLVEQAVNVIRTNARFMIHFAWILMHDLKSFRGCPQINLLCVESLEQRLINIPSS